MANQNHTLISPSQALEILTWVSPSGLYAGSRETKRLTRFPAGSGYLYSKEECEALRDEITSRGIALNNKTGRKAPAGSPRTEVV